MGGEEGDHLRVSIRDQLRLDSPCLRPHRLLLCHLSLDHPLRSLLLDHEARSGPVQHLLCLQAFQDQQEHPRLCHQLCHHLPAHTAALFALLQHREEQGGRPAAPPGHLFHNHVCHLLPPLPCPDVSTCLRASRQSSICRDHHKLRRRRILQEGQQERGWPGPGCLCPTYSGALAILSSRNQGSILSTNEIVSID